MAGNRVSGRSVTDEGHLYNGQSLPGPSCRWIGHIHINEYIFKIFKKWDYHEMNKNVALFWFYCQWHDRQIDPSKCIIFHEIRKSTDYCGNIIGATVQA